MNNPTKKAIAREGLIILSLVVIYILGVIVINLKYPDYPSGYTEMRYFELALVAFYFLYWLGRFATSFIIWAIRTLREK